MHPQRGERNQPLEDIFIITPINSNVKTKLEFFVVLEICTKREVIFCFTKILTLCVRKVESLNQK